MVLFLLFFVPIRSGVVRGLSAVRTESSETGDSSGRLPITDCQVRGIMVVPASGINIVVVLTFRRGLVVDIGTGGCCSVVTAILGHCRRNVVIVEA